MSALQTTANDHRIFSANRLLLYYSHKEENALNKLELILSYNNLYSSLLSLPIHKHVKYKINTFKNKNNTIISYILVDN